MTTEDDDYTLGSPLPKKAETKGGRPVPETSEARKKAFSIRAMTLEELDEAIAHVNGREITGPVKIK